jgi:PAS domain S-box-containing protein
MPDVKYPDDCAAINLHHIEVFYVQAFCNAPFPVLIARDDGRFLMINNAFKSATGYSDDTVPTIDSWKRHIRVIAAKDNQIDFAHFFDGESVPEPFRVSVRAKNGTWLTWELFISLLGKTTGGQRLIAIVATDVTHANKKEQQLESVAHRLEREISKKTTDLNSTINRLEREVVQRKQASNALALSRARLKSISRRTLDVLEADRQTVSKELHDSIGASLAAIKFSLEEKEILREENQGRLDQSLNQEIAHLQATIKESKRISANLRPTTLDDLGLIATIDWYLRQFRRLCGTIYLDYQREITEADVPEAMKIIIYRIVQEGLSNIQKHSEAKSVRLQIGFIDGGGSISLIIEDDGRGFDVDEVLSEKDPLSGYGLTAMRERCEIFGGSFHIESHRDQGTRINAILPI